MSSSSATRSPYGINILGQHPIFQSYGQIIAGFALPPSQAHDAVVHDIQRAASKLYTIFPRLAGQVVKTGVSSTSTGTFSIIPYPPSEIPSPVVIKDATNCCPPWSTLVAARAPMSMLPYEGLSKYNCWPHWLGRSEEPMPVLLIQTNIIDGGVLITFSLQHQAGDGAGFALVMQHFATLLRGKNISTELVDGAMSEEQDMLPLLRPGEERSTIVFPVRRTFPVAGDSYVPSTTPLTEAANWAIFRFSSASLALLKLRASENQENWVSTDDALLALLWSRISVVRARRGMAPSTMSQCSRAVDMRARCDPPLPKGYMGHSVLVCPVELPLGEVAKQPLSATARSLRQQLAKLDARYLRTVASRFTSTELKDTVELFEPPMDRAASVSMSSWAVFDVHKVDFGPLGKPYFCRRAGKSPLPNSSYVMPKFENGDLDLQVCFLENELEGLRVDHVWNEYAEWVG